MNKMWERRRNGIRQARMLAQAGVFASFLALAVPAEAYAAVTHLSQRLLDIHTPEMSAVTPYDISFAFDANTSVGSIEFQFCDSPLPQLACVAPVGLDVSQTNFNAQSGQTGFGLVRKTANDIVIYRAPTVNAIGMAAYRFDHAINPSRGGTFYVRISTYVTQDASGPYDAFGAAAAEVSNGVSLQTEVPPYLEFCVGIVIPQGCASADGYLADLGTLSSSRAAHGTSQLYVGTNANFGMTITVQGSTMTSGNDAIPPLVRPTNSAPGNGQFGFNLRANRDPAGGTDPAGAGVAMPTTDYNQPDAYTFRSGDIIASSTGTTDYRTFTVNYIANVDSTQTPGVYNTTLTYICTGSF